LLDDEPEHSIASLRELLATPQNLYDLAYASWRKFHEVFDVDKQLWARTRIIARELARPEALIVRPRPGPAVSMAIRTMCCPTGATSPQSPGGAQGHGTASCRADRIVPRSGGSERQPVACFARGRRAWVFLARARRALRTRLANLRTRVRRRLP